MEERVPQYLHMPMQVLWFDTVEWRLIAASYLVVVLFGFVAGAIALFLIIALIRYKRSRERGYFQHLIYEYGYSRIEHYPLPTAKVFHE